MAPWLDPISCAERDEWRWKADVVWTIDIGIVEEQSYEVRS